MSDPLLRTEGLVRRFGSFTAVDGVDLEIPAGELRGLIGPNGAGKTTLFDLLSGVLAPTAGHIWFDGEEITGLPAHRIARRGLARTLQITRPFPSLSVIENVLGAVYGARGVRSPLSRYADDEGGRDRAREVLARVGLEEAADTPAADLSHADQRLLELGLGLALDPDLLLLDEPTAGLSAGNTDEVTDLIRDLGEEVTILLVEHDMDVVMAVADRLTVLHQGAVLAAGTPAEIRENDRVRDVYFGRDR